MFKKCKKCEGWFYPAEDFFYIHKGCKDGLRPECKQCRINKVKEFYQENNEKILEQKKEYHIKNSCRINIIKKEYNSLNADKRSKWGKKYYIINRHRIRKRAKEYSKNNPEKIRASAKRSKHKRKSLERKVEANFSNNQWEVCKKHFNNGCCYCGKTSYLHQDHFLALSKGGEYTINNIVPACSTCNSSKYNHNFFEWYPRQKFYDKKREEKLLSYLNYNKTTKEQQLAFTI